MADHTIFVLYDEITQTFTYTPQLVRLTAPGWIIFRRPADQVYTFNEVEGLPATWKQETAHDGSLLYIYDPYDLDSARTQWTVRVSLDLNGDTILTPVGDGDPPIIRNDP
jgi:hypothetical protein